MKLITEVTNDLEYLTEEKDGRKHLYVSGPYISVDTPNRNNRVYSRSLMEPIVEGFLKDKVNNGSAFGEFGHPANGPKINEEKISHRITSLKWEGNHVIGKALILDEGASGKLMKNIIETGGKLGMSTRGLGSVKANDKGLQEVQSDFKLLTVDCVVEPSGAGCWVNGIMEGTEWIFDATKGTYMEKNIEELADTVKKMSNRERQEKQLMLFQYYLDNINEALGKKEYANIDGKMVRQSRVISPDRAMSRFFPKNLTRHNDWFASTWNQPNKVRQRSPKLGLSKKKI